MYTLKNKSITIQYELGFRFYLHRKFILTALCCQSGSGASFRFFVILAAYNHFDI